MPRLKALLYAATSLSQLPVVLAVWWLIEHLWPAAALWVALAVGAGGVALLRGRLRLYLWDRPISPWRQLLLEEPYLVHWCAGLVALPGLGVAAIAAGLGAMSTGAASVDWGRASAIAYGVGLLVGIWGVSLRPRWVRVRQVVVLVPGLGAAFEGMRIVQLSDLHIGSMCPPARARRWIARSNDLDPDVVALTGDYATMGVGFHDAIASTLGGLQAQDGVLAVMGNHDYFGDGAPLVSKLRDAGITVLRNECTTLRRGDDRLQLVGVDDLYTERADVPAALAGRDESVPTVALVHDPVLAGPLLRGGCLLVLSGHTHGGQVLLAGWAWRRLVQERGSKGGGVGGAEEGRGPGAGTGIVSGGLGTTGPPVRLGVAPEIVVIRLRRA